ncbi:MAG: hypothetical protein P8N76_13715 [Pirellulaceae bacterium]|nr:hypothetical protein [Pirellulaceae bacterium]
MGSVGRRTFIQRGIATGALASLGDLGFLSKLRPLAADELIETNVVQMRPEIEPLVRLLETTPRDRVLEVFADRIQRGTSYQEILATLLLAGVRNVQPRPSVGFKFHAVLVVNSAHLASLASPDTDRWLPIFWALDYFKSSQARDIREGNWTMPTVDAKAMPSPEKALADFQTSMDHWDEAAADASVATLARNVGANELFEQFARYGIRDYRSIGHKAIFVANSWRTLQCIGWQHSEPVLRSLAYALLNHSGEPNPHQSDLKADRPYRENLERQKRIKSEWLTGRPSHQASLDLLSTLREGTPQDASEQVVKMINEGVAVQSIYDAIFAAAGELLMRQPGIVALHSMTTTNAMHYAFQTSSNKITRQLTLLQNAAFLPMFRDSMKDRGAVGSTRIDQLAAAEIPADPSECMEAIFAQISTDRNTAAQQLFGYLEQGNSATDVIQGARRLIFLKGHDSHDYKFSSAALEDYFHISPNWRNRYLAASVFNLKGTGDQDNQLTNRTRDALKQVTS